MMRWPTVSATRLVEVLLAASVLIIVALLTSGLMPMSKREVPDLPVIVDAMAALTLLCCIAWTINALRFARAPRDRRIQHAGRLALIVFLGNQAMALPVMVFGLVSLERIEQLAPPEEIAEVLRLVSGKERGGVGPTWKCEWDSNNQGDTMDLSAMQSIRRHGESSLPFRCALASGSYVLADAGTRLMQGPWSTHLRQVGVDYAGVTLEYPSSTMWSVRELYTRTIVCRDWNTPGIRLDDILTHPSDPLAMTECRILTTEVSCESLDTELPSLNSCSAAEKCTTLADACRHADLASAELRKYVFVLYEVLKSAGRLYYFHPGSRGSAKVVNALLLVESVVFTTSIAMEILTAASASTGLTLFGAVMAVIIGSYALCGSLGVVFTPGHVAMSTGALFAVCLTLLLASRIFPRLYRRAYANLSLAAWAAVPLAVWQAFVDNEYLPGGNTLDALGWRHLDGHLLATSTVVLIAVSIAVVAGVRAIDRELFSRPQ